MRRHELGLQSCLAVGPQNCDVTADAEVQLRTRERQKTHASNVACQPDAANFSRVQRAWQLHSSSFDPELFESVPRVSSSLHSRLQVWVCRPQKRSQPRSSSGTRTIGPFRAEEARTIHDTLRDPDCKRLMNGIAECYERLADLTRDFQKAAAAHWSQSQ